MNRIVVGVDGSAAAAVALAWAVAEARAHRASVEVWHAWHVTYPLHGPPPDEHVAELAARAVLDSAVDAVETEGLPVRRVLVRAIPASALLDASRQADLVVIGAARSRAGQAGQVASQVVAHAHCTVVVVPAWQQGRSALTAPSQEQTGSWTP